MARRKTKRKESLNYHEGLSFNQIKIILKEFNLDFGKFDKWLYGQTCPLIRRTDKTGTLVKIAGVYEYDLFRWIENQKAGTPLIFD